MLSPFWLSLIELTDTLLDHCWDFLICADTTTNEGVYMKLN